MLVTADFASVEPATGKLNILGEFRSISSVNFPARHRRMAVVVKLGGELTDNQDQYILRVALADEDGNELICVEGSFKLPHAPAGIRPEYNIILELQDIVFPKPGAYRIYITVGDGVVKGSKDLVLAQRQPPNQE